LSFLDEFFFHLTNLRSCSIWYFKVFIWIFHCLCALFLLYFHWKPDCTNFTSKDCSNSWCWFIKEISWDIDSLLISSFFLQNFKPFFHYVRRINFQTKKEEIKVFFESFPISSRKWKSLLLVFNIPKSPFKINNSRKLVKYCIQWLNYNRIMWE
jgi:hypothetical protein